MLTMVISEKWRSMLQDDLISVRACPDCGQHNRLLSEKAGMVMECSRCGKALRRVHHHSRDKVLCFSLAGIFFYIALFNTPLLDISLWGRIRANTLLTGPSAFNADQYWLLGGLVFFTTIAMPFIRLFLTFAVMLGLRLSKPPRLLPHLFRWSKEVDKWAMPEIYLLGLLVAYTRLQKLVFIQVDSAVYALIGMILAFILMEAVLDSESIWQRMENKGLTDRAPQDPALPVRLLLSPARLFFMYRPMLFWS
jgi:paraquat-inducible protein A